jgi:hypothetical protein
MHKFTIAILQVQFYLHKFTCAMLHAQCYMHNFTIAILQVQFYLHNFTCAMLHAQWYMHNLKSANLHAQFYTRNFTCTLLQVQFTSFVRLTTEQMPALVNFFPTCLLPNHGCDFVYVGMSIHQSLDRLQLIVMERWNLDRVTRWV